MEITKLGVEVAYNLDEILPEVDVVNLLRVQFERQRGAFFPSIAEYAHLFGMNGDRIRRGRSNLLVLAPGPINRGVELTPEVADGQHSAILQQVSNGLLVRMACVSLLAREALASPATATSLAARNRAYDPPTGDQNTEGGVA